MNDHDRIGLPPNGALPSIRQLTAPGLEHSGKKTCFQIALDMFFLVLHTASHVEDPPAEDKCSFTPIPVDACPRRLKSDFLSIGSEFSANL